MILISFQLYIIFGSIIQNNYFVIIYLKLNNFKFLINPLYIKKFLKQIEFSLIVLKFRKLKEI